MDEKQDGDLFCHDFRKILKRFRIINQYECRLIFSTEVLTYDDSLASKVFLLVQLN